MRTLCVALCCLFAFATSGFAASVTVADSSTALPGVANDTAAVLLDAGLAARNAGGGKYVVTANNFHCDERNNGALPASDVHAGVDTIACRINSQNQRGSTAGRPFGDQRALHYLLQKIQESDAGGGATFLDCAMGYCGTFAKSITCTVDTAIENYSDGGRWSCTYVDGQ